MRVSPSICLSLLSLLLLSTSACAAKQASAREAYPNAADYAAEYAEYGGEGVADSSIAAPSFAAPAAGPAPGLGTAGVFAAPKAASRAAGSDGEAGSGEPEPALETLDTFGDDSVDQMLIFQGQLALRVEHGEIAETIDHAVGLAVAAGGYVAEMTDTSLRLRVPSKRFRKVMSQVEDLGEVQTRAVSALDVSEEFHDLEVQLANLKATRERIEKLLGQAKDLSQILTIEAELQRVTGEIDRIEGRMRLLSSRAAFSTIDLAVGERPQQQEDVKIATDTPPPPPRTLPGSASWVHDVGVHALMDL